MQENGTKYEGEYVKDMRHGKGKYTYVNGDWYKGMIQINLVN